MKNIFAIAIALLLFPLNARCESPPNILLLMVDDLKPLMGAYGDTVAKTPVMDALAARGAVFENAVCQVSVCAPSRASILTGLRPDTLKNYTNAEKFRRTVPDAVTLPQAFHQAGYFTASIGKVYDARNRDPGGWDEELLPSSEKTLYALESNEQMYHENDARFKAASTKEKQTLWRVGPAMEAEPLDESHYFDGKVAAAAVEMLRRIKDKPFFLGVGFTKPHLPFACPKKYWDLYDREEIPLPVNRDRPEHGVVPMAYHDGFELRQYQGIPHEGKLDDDLTRALIHGYYACASFADAMVGRVLAELDALGLTDNTIIVLMGDHGWHLGDKEIWCKFTAFQEASIAPLLVIDPRRKGGEHISSLVEFVDIYPTLCELAGVTPPEGLEGMSFVPLLDASSRAWKTAAFSQVGRGAAWKEFIGTSMRTEGFNYIEWRHRVKDTLRARELYDLKTDPREMNNLISDPEHEKLIEQLAKQMQAGWEAAVPKQ